MARATSLKEQERIAEEGVVIGTVSAVRAACHTILMDGYFHRIEAVYGPNPKPKPGKEPGTKYSVVAKLNGPTKGIRTEEESAKRTVDNDLLPVYCAETNRRSWRTLKLPCVKKIQVFTGKRTAEGKLASVMVPVVVVTPDRTPGI